MGVEIHFLGALLFVGRGNQLEHVLLPNGETDPDWVGGQPNKKLWTHPDGSTAKAHYAGLTVARQSQPRRPEFISLRDGCTVNIGSGGVPIAQRWKDMIPDLSAHPLNPTSNALASTVTLGGQAAVTRSGPEERRFGFKNKNQYVLGLKVVFDAPTLTIVIAGAGQPAIIDVAQDDYVAVYNYDYPYPSQEQLELRNELVCDGKQVIDHDFKWLYSLLDSGNDYSAPSASCVAPKILTPFVSSCFSGGHWSA